MATETLNVSGLSASDSGDFSGAVTNIDEAVASADGSIMSSSANGENETLRVALTDVVSITDGDTVTNVSVTLRGRATGGGNNSFDVTLYVGGTAQGTAGSGGITATMDNYTGINQAGWNTDWTAAQLNGAELLITCKQSGMNVAAQWEVDCLDVIVTYSAGPSESVEHYRFTYDQNNNDIAATTGYSHESATDFPFATGSSEDTAFTSAELDTTYCLVTKVYNSGDSASGSIHQLEFRVDTGAGFGSWTTCNASSTPVQVVPGSDDDLQTSAVERLSATAAASYKGSVYEDTAGNAGLSLTADQDGEAHYSLQFLSSGLSAGDDIEFRLNNTTDTALVTNTVTPSATIAAGTPQQNANITGTGTVSTVGTVVSRLRSYTHTGSGTAGLYMRPRVWLNTTQTLTGATEMTVTSFNEAGTSITFSDPSGAPTGSLFLGVENLKTGDVGWIAVTVNNNDKVLTFTGTGGVAATRIIDRLRAYSYSGAGTSGVTKETATEKTYTGTGTSVGEQARVTLLDLTFSGAGASTIVKDMAQAISLAGTGSPTTLGAQADRLRSLAYSGTGSSTIAKGSGKALSFAGVGTLVANAQLTFLQSLNMAGTGAVTLLRQLAKVFSYTGTAARTLVKATDKATSYSGTGTAEYADAITYTASHAYSGVGTVDSTQDLGLTEQDLIFTGAGTVTRGAFEIAVFKTFSGTGAATQSNDGTPIEQGMQVGDDDWWRRRRIMRRRRMLNNRG